jgi:hypothetical protein
VKQTIGRLRLAEQERGTRPLYLLIGEPLDSIRVDEVTTCQEWLEINNPAWWQAEEVSTMKIATPETLGILKTANETRANEARAKVERAVIALQEDGKRVSMRTVSAYTGLSRTTVNRYLSDVLKNSKPTVTLREPLYSISYNSPRSVTPLNEDLSSNHRPVTPPEDESCRSVTPSNDSRPVTPEATVPVVNTDPRAEEYPEDAEAWVEVLETVMQLSPNTGLLASLRALRCQGLRMEPQGDKYRLTYDSGRRCVIHTAEDAALECCALLYQHQAELTRLGVDVPTVDNQTEARARVRAVFGNGVMMEFEAITTTTGKEWVIVE